ncbi:COX15/CtaA family protein [Prochlorococcus marinus]|uniref:Heme A synthase n=1 Tax=Prochlorococcus marinus XMU1408 TaxID=2213228 RepID=A0A318R9A2_PROMR|nr:COX15/CtaA family protein [Prochlorococcus marinus]MBW3041471.1 heme A synthase [Prochlorococcus marinus str. XMU1408]PYE02629.1 heme A synthase [Prochlorococcus marinus XMU1408]
MQVIYPPKPRFRLGQLAAHVVVALIVLVVIGGATRVMEAGLACPDWPLCYGSFLPGSQMNLQVFLEWFHRLDAFFVGIVLIIQFSLSLYWAKFLPMWLPWTYGALTCLVAFQGFLGALTVLQLLPSLIVVLHLAVALTLVAIMSGVTQQLLSPGKSIFPLWLRSLGFLSLFSVIGQSLLGSRVATSWAAQRCLNIGDSCNLLRLHRFSAFPVSLLVILFVIISFTQKDVFLKQWPYFVSITFLIISQIFLGVFSIQLGLSEPGLVIGHQLVACLLVAVISALNFKGNGIEGSSQSLLINESNLETCHG